MTPRFFIAATGEIVIPKPTGCLEFWKDDKLVSEITLSSETAAIEYAKHREGWKEITAV